MALTFCPLVLCPLCDSLCDFVFLNHEWTRMGHE